MSFHPKMAYDATFHKSARELEDEGPPFVYTPENRARFDEIVTRYPPDHGARRCCRRCIWRSISRATSPRTRSATSPSCSGSRRADVEDVVSFYTMFYTKPVGTFVLQVCRTLSCALNGAERVTEELSAKLRHQAGRDRSRAAPSRCSRSSASAPAIARRSSW